MPRAPARLSPGLHDALVVVIAALVGLAPASPRLAAASTRSSPAADIAMLGVSPRTGLPYAAIAPESPRPTAPAAIQSDGTWAELLPPQREAHGAVLDPLRGRMLVLGGVNSAGPRGELWALSLTGAPAWSRVAYSGTAPSFSNGMSVVYVPALDAIYVFGGATGTEVWTLPLGASPTWTAVAPVGGPPPARTAASIIHDAPRNRLLLFGGQDAFSGEALNDLWSLSLTGTPTWTPITPAGARPSRRYHHSAVVDVARQRMVVFGGRGSVSSFDDAWSFALSGTPGWTQLTGVGAAPSGPLDRHAAVADGPRDRMLVFGGTSNAVWALSLATNTWSTLTPTGAPPLPRIRHSAVFDAAGNRMLVFGGTRLSGTFQTLGDTFALSLAGAPAWSALIAQPAVPDQRGAASAVFDPSRSRMLVHGGWDTQQLFRDTWALRTNTSPPVWQALATGGPLPPGRQFHAAAFSSARDVMLVHGGSTNPDIDAFGDLWQLSFATSPQWSSLAAAGTPPAARSLHAMIHDPLRDRMILLLGGSPATRFDDVWELTLGATPTWRRLFPGGAAPSARAGAMAVVDSRRDRILVFGGFDGDWRNDIRALTLGPGDGQWSVLAPSGAPPSRRTSGAVVYDVGRDRFVVHGGFGVQVEGAGGTSIGFLDDVWALSLSPQLAWRRLDAPPDGPGARDRHGACYDNDNGRMIVFGGTINGANDTWFLTFGGLPVPTAVALTRVDASPEQVALEWHGATPGATARVDRRVRESAWAPLGVALADGEGRIAWLDRDVEPGASHAYRLAFDGGAGETIAGLARVDVPASSALAVRGIAGSGGAGLALSITLPQALPARLEVADVAGRIVAHRRLEGLGAGAHTVWFAEPLPAGVYVVRLTCGGAVAVGKAVAWR